MDRQLQKAQAQLNPSDETVFLALPRVPYGDVGAQGSVKAAKRRREALTDPSADIPYRPEGGDLSSWSSL